MINVPICSRANWKCQFNLECDWTKPSCPSYLWTNQMWPSAVKSSSVFFLVPTNNQNNLISSQLKRRWVTVGSWEQLDCSVWSCSLKRFQNRNLSDPTAVQRITNPSLMKSFLLGHFFFTRSIFFTLQLKIQTDLHSAQPFLLSFIYLFFPSFLLSFLPQRQTPMSQRLENSSSIPNVSGRRLAFTLLVTKHTQTWVKESLEREGQPAFPPTFFSHYFPIS